MRILVCGGRNFSDRETVRRALNRVYSEVCAPWDPDDPPTLVHGACRGADLLAAEVASAMRWKMEPHPADWGAHGKAAGPIRNEEMAASKPDYAIVFEGGAGTADMMRRLVAHRISFRFEPADEG